MYHPYRRVEYLLDDLALHPSSKAAHCPLPTAHGAQDIPNQVDEAMAATNQKAHVLASVLARIRLTDLLQGFSR